MLLVFALACNDDPPQRAAPTYYGEARAILDTHCATCHYAGGSTPFALDTYEAAAPLAEALVAAVESGAMPPWKPDPDCRHYQGERLFPAEALATLRAWSSGGAAEGEADGIPPVAPASSLLTDANRSGRVPSYTPQLASEDDYRCFVLDALGLEAGGFVTGAEIVPGTTPVHHVLVYAYPETDRAMIEAADAADPTVGYACAGSGLPSTSDAAVPDELVTLLRGDLPTSSGSGGGFPNQLAGWAPGSPATVLPEGTAIPVDPGAVVVAQVHYSRAGGDATPDQTEVRLRVTEVPPVTAIRTSALLIYDLDIAAGTAHSAFQYDAPYYGSQPLLLRSIAGHMHQLGTRITGEELAGEVVEDCLLDIPDWDFHWQGGYRPLDDDPIVVESGHRVRLTCEYDNSAENQAFVGGTQLTPTDVSWGESTTDEMCLLYLGRMTPYLAPVPEGAPACSNVADCTAACAPDDWACTSACAATDPTCGACVSSAVQDCAPACALQLFADTGCASECLVGQVLLGGNLQQCLDGECPDVGAALASCVADAVGEPTCAAAVAVCGL